MLSNVFQVYISEPVDNARYSKWHVVAYVDSREMHRGRINEKKICGKIEIERRTEIDRSMKGRMEVDKGEIEDKARE